MCGTIGGAGYETVLSLLPVRHSQESGQTRKEAGRSHRELTCREIKRATVDGRHFCGIQKRGSFSDEQDVVGVSSHLFL